MIEHLVTEGSRMGFVRVMVADTAGHTATVEEADIRSALNLAKYYTEVMDLEGAETERSQCEAAEILGGLQ